MSGIMLMVTYTGYWKDCNRKDLELVLLETVKFTVKE